MGRPLVMTGSGEVMLKSKVLFTSGVSWQGKIDRAWIAWHCETDGEYSGQTRDAVI
jgi:hypothetical protein